MTAPVIPTDLVYPVRGEDRVQFANKANTFNQRLVDEFAPQQNSLAGWMNTTADSIQTTANDAATSADNASTSASEAFVSEQNAATSAANASSQVTTALDLQNQANALLGAGIGGTYLQDGDLYITYAEAFVSDVTINNDGQLSIVTV